MSSILLEISNKLEKANILGDLDATIAKRAHLPTTNRNSTSIAVDSILGAVNTKIISKSARY